MSQKPGMVECPKCGFHQPPDRYCASCGVDMQSFKPKASVWSNAYLQFFVAALVVFCSLFIIHKKAEERLEQRAEALADAEESFASQYRPENQQAEAAQYAATADTVTQPTSVRHPSPPKQRQAPRQFQAATVAATAPTTTPTKAKTPPQFRVTFAEVPRYYLEEILRSGRVTGYGNQVAVVPKIKTVINDGRTSNNIKVLAQSKTEDLVVDKTISIFEGYIDEELEQKIGFTIQVTPTSLEENAVDLQIEILRELRDYDNGTPIVNSQPFQENLRLSGEAGAMMTGTLPLPQQIAEDDRGVISGTIFKIYNSEAFQEAQSDFTLFFEVSRN